MHIKPILGDIKLTELKPAHLQRFYTLKLEEGLSNSTVRHFHNIMHKALTQATRWGMVPRNVADLVTPPPLVRTVPVVWTRQQATQFLMHIKGSRYEGIFALALSTGMRRGEILALQIRDIDWDKGTIQVSRSIQSISGRGLVVSEPKTEGSRRTIVVPRFALKILAEHIKRNEDKSGFVFATSHGTPFSPRNILRFFSSAVEEAGLPKISFHKLRHTFATMHLAIGTNPKIIQEILGHKVIALTLGTYSHVLPGLQGEAAKVTDSLLSTATGTATALETAQLHEHKGKKRPQI
jgi:integrase